MWVLKKIPLTKIQRYAKNDLFENIVSWDKSVKSELCLKERKYKEPLVASTYEISNKNACYLVALQNIGIMKNYTE